jgi:hypothetical protein
MKHNLKTEGEVELNHEEGVQAMLQYLRQEKKLLEAMDALLGPKLGVKATKVALFDKDGKVGFKVEVTSNPEKRGYFASPTVPGEKRQPTGFIRKNVGFYKELVTYLDEERRKKRKQITIDEAFEDLLFVFPGLDKRNFSIYVRDKRQQKAKGFKFDGKNNVFIL